MNPSTKKKRNTKSPFYCDNRTNVSFNYYFFFRKWLECVLCACVCTGYAVSMKWIHLINNKMCRVSFWNIYLWHNMNDMDRNTQHNYYFNYFTQSIKLYTHFDRIIFCIFRIANSKRIVCLVSNLKSNRYEGIVRVSVSEYV